MKIKCDLSFPTAIIQEKFYLLKYKTIDVYGFSRQVIYFVLFLSKRQIYRDVSFNDSLPNWPQPLELS